MQEGKTFSRNHKLFGFKVEVSVLSNGFAVHYVKHHPGSVSDLVVFEKSRRFHHSTLKKIGEESSITDIGLLSENFTSH